MPTIANENQKNIRKALNVEVHLQQLQSIPLSFSVTNAFVYTLSTLTRQGYDLMQLTDLSADGFSLDGSRTLYDLSLTDSASLGKWGIRSRTGMPMYVTVSSTSTITALSIRVFGQGTIEANGNSYDVSEYMVIPVNARSITLTCTPDADYRISIEDVTPGIILDFNNDNLISCDLDLESDLSITDADWKVSSIEIQAYYPYDISEAVSNMGDGIPITYSAGYPGDMSPVRYFYLSEEVTQSNNLLTIKGEDASSRLDDYTQDEAMWVVPRTTARREIYQRFVTYLNKAGIKLVSKEGLPPAIGTNATKFTLMIQEGTFREHIQYLMDINNKNGFYPRFVDAGRPTLRWSPPSYKWSIYKSDIGDFERIVDRNINRIYGSDAEKPLVENLYSQGSLSTIATETVKAGELYSFSWDEDYYNVQVTNGEVVSRGLRSITVRAYNSTITESYTVQSGWTTVTKKYDKNSKIDVSLAGNNLKDYKKTKSGNYIVITWKEPKYTKTSKTFNQMIVRGYKVVPAPSVSSNVVTVNRYGVTKEYTPMWYGMLYSNYGSSYYRIPEYSDFFNKSNIKGSFTYKGNPKMQPRDVFRLYELDGTTYTTCTIESIEMQHQDGGTSCKITYREGVY